MLLEGGVLKRNAGNTGLLCRLRSNALNDSDIQQLSGEAYRRLAQKACEQKEWRALMEPVTTDGKALWVSKAVANDASHGYKIISL